MEIYPIAADSLGTRSMATLVKSKGCNIFIDPGVSLGPRRYGLPPHPIEIRRMEEHWKVIRKFALKCDVIVITHYHYDHHNPDADIYKEKTLLLKHPTQNINFSQKQRASYFLEKLGNSPKKISYIDGAEFSFKETSIKFSKPVFHGPNKRLGFVTQVLISEEDFSFLYTSDVEGPCLEDQIKYILDENPQVIYLDGPLSYMLGYRYSMESLKNSVKNMEIILKNTKVQKMIVDHHLLRDIIWKNRIKNVYDVAKKMGKKVITAAEYLGLKNDILEARRKELYGEA